jgi:hypothetical protein
VLDHWNHLKAPLLNASENWQVWTDWYEDRLFGRIASEKAEFAQATIADEFVVRRF